MEGNPMTQLTQSLASWGTDSFSKAFKEEVEGLDSGTLPLEKGTNRGGPVDDSDLSISLLHTDDNDAFIEAKMGVFFYEISAGGACGDAPLKENAYCVILVSIDKTTAETEFTVVFE